MSGDASAYAALGLDPGAERADIERAYKRLIKEHHPDREGGDGTRAAEINRAYRELRGPSVKDALEFNDEWLGPAGRRGWRLVLGGAALGLIAGIALAGSLGAPIQRLWTVPAPPVAASSAAVAGPSDIMNQPLNLPLIDAAAHEALRVSRSKDEMALTDASRDCHRLLRTEPTIARLDRCAAFDDAVVQLQDRDPLRDRGPFSQLAVTGRQWSAASSLSNDYLAIDSRLDRIRLRVELMLAPVLEQGAPA